MEWLEGIKVIIEALRLYSVLEKLWLFVQRRLLKAKESHVSNKYVEIAFADVREVERKKEIIMDPLVDKKIKSQSEEVRQKIEMALRFLVKDVYLPAFVQKLTKSKFWKYKVGEYRLIFGKTDKEILIVDFLHRNVYRQI